MFGTLSPEAPPLADYIGNLIGSRIGRVFRGTPKILGTTSQILHNNWKLYIENVKDTYHASLLHTFFTTFRLSRLTTKAASRSPNPAATTPATPMASSAATMPIPTRLTGKSTRCTKTTNCTIRASSTRSTRSATA